MTKEEFLEGRAFVFTPDNNHKIYEYTHHTDEPDSIGSYGYIFVYEYGHRVYVCSVRKINEQRAFVFFFKFGKRHTATLPFSELTIQLL